MLQYLVTYVLSYFEVMYVDTFSHNTYDIVWSAFSFKEHFCLHIVYVVPRVECIDWQRTFKIEILCSVLFGRMQCLVECSFW